MKRTRLLMAACATAALALLLLSGCGGTMPIRALLDDAPRYDNKTVRIAGTVSSSVGALGFAAYRVDDGTGTLTVVTKDGGSPREGAKVGVKGTFRSAFTLGTQTIAALVEKSRGAQ